MPSESSRPVRVGIPYRTRKEELSGWRDRYQWYVDSVRRAGGEAVEISLAAASANLKKVADSLDAIVLTGSPADVDPARYNTPRHFKTADADPDRERTDFALLEHAFVEQKPVLAICYGAQLLNVFCGGSLIQHISASDESAEVRTAVTHASSEQRDENYRHPIRIEPDSRVARLAGATNVNVNSSHHQAILQPGRGLRVVAHAPDGVAEAVEWTGDANWVTGVQWHPERMADSEQLSTSLFRDLMAAARKSLVQS